MASKLIEQNQNIWWDRQVDKLKKSVLITDLDNTLFDWVTLWYVCFTAMLDEISGISRIPIAALKPGIRQIHQRHGTSEYSFLIEELPQLQEFLGGRPPLEVFRPAIEAYQRKRRETLSLYPTVAETLLKAKGGGSLIVGYTESMAFYSNYRVRRLGLDGVFDFVFSPSDHEIPTNIPVETIRLYPRSHYEFRFTQQRHTPAGSLKPDPAVLADIVAHLKKTPSDCVYVGDSLHKDVAMARDADVTDVFARYGRAQHTEAYTLLKEVTHWTDAEVERERRITEREVRPGIILDQSFGQLLEFIDFGNGNGR
ncbi:MAG: HAD family hydrolase [Sulfuricaulis sp.]|uniref:HAD family hydrolase n=1 Tax=Sulfuricaulis sp. TaxID=2003553 RepID=UPI0034A59028